MAQTDFVGFPDAVGGPPTTICLLDPGTGGPTRSWPELPWAEMALCADEGCG